MRLHGGAQPIKKSQPANQLASLIWWSWGDLNPRPSAFIEQIYMFSGLIWVSP